MGAESLGWDEAGGWRGRHGRARSCTVEADRDGVISPRERLLLGVGQIEQTCTRGRPTNAPWMGLSHRTGRSRSLLAPKLGHALLSTMVRRPMTVFAIAVVTASIPISGCAGVGPQGGASAACAAPVIELEDSSLKPGGVVQLTVEGLVDTCEDTGGRSRPAENVTVTITSSPSGDEFLLGRPTPAGPHSAVSGAFDLPGELPPGDAVLSVRSHDGDRTRADLAIVVDPLGAS